MLMECNQCLAENAIMISKQGSGYGYIGNTFFYKRHKTNKIIEPVKWTNNEPYKITHISKNNK